MNSLFFSFEIDLSKYHFNTWNTLTDYKFEFPQVIFNFQVIGKPEEIMIIILLLFTYILFFHNNKQNLLSSYIGALLFSLQ